MQGPLYQSILKAGGSKIANDLVDKRGDFKLSFGGLVDATQGYSLDAKFVIHAKLQNYDYKDNFQS